MTTLHASLESTAERPPPSRGDNPFATCWTRPGALPFLSHDGVSVERVLDRWFASGCRGQVLGPHGVGKSALLASAGGALAEWGWAVERRVFRSDQQPAESNETAARFASARMLLLVDGLEQLAWWRRRSLLRACRGEGLGVLASTHHATRGLPVLAELTPSQQLVRALHAELTRERPSPVTANIAAEVFAQTNGDVRELWFRLYDLHESLA